MRTNALNSHPTMNKAAKVFTMAIVCLGMSIYASKCFGANLRKVTGEPGTSPYDAAVNQNFERVNTELSNAVHKTSTETIHGYKYFVEPVDFSSATIDYLSVSTISATQVTATTGTFTFVGATTGTITNVVSTTITLNGLRYAGNPVGTVVMYVSTSVIPLGWLACNGASVSTATYNRLFAATTYTFGGSGANFNLPDFRGIFPKGAGTTNRAAGVDANGNAYAGTNGTYTQDKFQGHVHTIVDTTAAGATITGNGQPAAIPPHNGTGAFVPVTGSPSTDGTNGTPRTGLTTEPQSLGINFIICAGI